MTTSQSCCNAMANSIASVCKNSPHQRFSFFLDFHRGLAVRQFALQAPAPVMTRFGDENSLTELIGSFSVWNGEVSIGAVATGGLIEFWIETN